VTSQPDPTPRPPARPAAGPPSKPPRSAMTVRDMLVALGILVLIVIGFGALSGSWSFAPTGPSIDPGAVPVVDAAAELGRLAPLMPFPVREPAVPAGWRVNSVDQDPVTGGGKAVRSGYVTQGGRYLQLLQSDASEAALLTTAAGQAPVPGHGPVDVDGQRWVVYGGQGSTAARAEPVWITEVATPGGSPVRMLLTGSGNDEEFRTLAAAAVGATPLPR
jgi:Protein of unknown function (DUF4245)